MDGNKTVEMVKKFMTDPLCVSKAVAALSEYKGRNGKQKGVKESLISSAKELGLDVLFPGLIGILEGANENAINYWIQKGI